MNTNEAPNDPLSAALAYDAMRPNRNRRSRNGRRRLRARLVAAMVEAIAEDLQSWRSRMLGRFTDGITARPSDD